MPSLSQEEKDKIKAECEYRFLIKKEIISKKTFFRKLSNFCSHPFIITIIGGFVLAVLGVVMNYNIQLQETRRQPLSIAVSEIDKDLNLLYNMRYFRLKITGNKDGRKEPDSLKRSTRELKEAFAEVVNEMAKGHKGIASLFAIQTVFNDPDTQKIARLLIKEWRQLEENDFQSKAELLKHVHKMEDQKNDLALKMGEEIRHFTLF
ncbi:hypothetical protein [Geomonas paludis]|uniref:Uncharacterized protein n=1 Tax=Geomonas paludis TaxID=2740185 RepID=A0A6V8MQZ9_9BACT|nr:hypothetical protein [Geomonas paludis]GFO62518.1 hypothetical protein GMPD_04370 [Geomonas paludis]